MDNDAMAQDEVVTKFNEDRLKIKHAAAQVRVTLDGMSFRAVLPSEQRGEVMANLTLAYRHLEDASMRIGKAIQARDGGASVYDKATTVGA